MLQPARGTEDFYPTEKAVELAIFEKLRRLALAWGYGEIESPAFEHLHLLERKTGPEIREQIFLLEKRGAEQLGLRFDMTVPAVRMFIARQKELPKPVRWFYADKMWRYEAPQKARAREFYQFGVELFGSAKPQADAELLELLAAAFAALGLGSDDVVIKINNRKLLIGLLDFVPAAKLEELLRLIDKSRRLSPGEFDRELARLGVGATRIKEILATRALDELERGKLNELATEGLGELKAVFALLDSVTRAFVELDLSIARGLAYYTGTVYEAFDRQGRLRALAGGGRYDDLIELLGGSSTPASGWAIGYLPLTLFLAEKGLLPKPATGPDYLIAPVSELLWGEAQAIAGRLRAKGEVVAVDVSGRGLSGQLDYASAIGARKVIIVGSRELEQGFVTVRDMTSGREEKVKLTEL